MSNFAEWFDSLAQSSNQKKISVVSALGIFYGFSSDGHMRLSFLSKAIAPKLESTKFLRVTQGEESIGVYWTCFDLMQNDAKSVYYTFCEDLVSAVTEVDGEAAALNALKKRFTTWKSMFKRAQTVDVSREVIQGLYGELYFLKNYMLEHYSPNEAIGAWAGADSKSKDFSINDEWFEIKTIGTNTNTVRISSLGQLASTAPGHLVIIKTESMSQEFVGENSSINMLLKDILLKALDEVVEEQLFNKIGAVVGNLTDSVLGAQFSVTGVDFYLVDDRFPRLQKSNIPFAEIEDVQYSLHINLLEKYKEKK